MFDVMGALLLVGLVYATNKWFTAELWPTCPKQLKIPFAAGIGVAWVFGFGATLWAHTQVINGLPLDKIDGASKAFAGVLLGVGGATGFDTILKTVRNIGQNDGPDVSTD